MRELSAFVYIAAHEIYERSLECIDLSKCELSQHRIMRPPAMIEEVGSWRSGTAPINELRVSFSNTAVTPIIVDVTVPKRENSFHGVPARQTTHEKAWST